MMENVIVWEINKLRQEIEEAENVARFAEPELLPGQLMEIAGMREKLNEMYKMAKVKDVRAVTA